MTDEPNMKPGDEAPPDEPAAAENTCEHCAGTGQHEGETCHVCQGTGVVEEAVGGG